MKFILLILFTNSVWANPDCRIVIHDTDHYTKFGLKKLTRVLTKKGYEVVQQRDEANLVLRDGGYLYPERNTGRMVESQFISITGDINGKTVRSTVSTGGSVFNPFLPIKYARLKRKIKTCNQIIDLSFEN